MDYIPLVSLFILGLIIGSFLNVVILRWNTGWSIAKGRSKCFSCGKKLVWTELLPVLSYIFQKGRCRGCGGRISVQYPIVELATALALPAVYIVEPSFFAPVAIAFCLYLVIFVYDIKHKIIPDFFSYTTALIGLAMIATRWYLEGYVDLNQVVAGPLLFLFFFFFWYVSKGRWMGLGDAKLALSVGWILGLWHGLAALLLSFWIGAAFALVLMVYQKGSGIGMKSQIPFGPFIIIGFAISYLLDIDIQAILLFLAV